jgi:hypothetical protein
MAYKALYDCYTHLSNSVLGPFLELTEKRLADHPQDGLLGMSILDELMALEQDSISANYTLPLARKLQTIPIADPELTYISDVSALYEFLLLKRLKRDKQARQFLVSFLAKKPNEAFALFELGRLSILSNNFKQGFIYLRKAKLHLNNLFTSQDFTGELMSTDFDKVRTSKAYKELND